MTVEKKTYLIRESDYKQLIREAGYKRNRNKKQFDRAKFTPITKEWLQKQYTWLAMKGDKRRAHIFKHWPYPADFLHRLDKIKQYDSRYKHWLVGYNEEGVMTVRAGINQPVSLLGLAVFELDLPEDSNETTT